MSGFDPAAYEAWYHTSRGAWIAERETALLLGLLQGRAGENLLDVGAGTGHFSRRFASAGYRVIALDPDPAMLAHARSSGGAISYIEGSALELPFADQSFDYCAAITSLCFVAQPARAVAEMWRVARRGVLLGLLNRRSLLHKQKAGRGSYRGARWDTVENVREWAGALPETPKVRFASAIVLPGAGPLARALEPLVPRRLAWGGFLAAMLAKP